ncbi:hypothetical protein CTEN210_18267 [Chaetoceros tenuissimus]|uniref:Uncharacterized protein n=1 Tax=Chaetoceros tenuissimus TaxID=426638 RepID=A0AAD3DEF9_9STRA|nr:hypothetical protein CTEN210_18267 [Chaetoceros tenuissimus]
MKISKKARRATGLVLLSLSAFIAFYDCNDGIVLFNKQARSLTEDFDNNNKEEDEITKSHFPTIIDSQFDKMNRLQIVLPSIIDETPQQIITELFSNPKVVIEERHRDCKATAQVKITFDTTNTVVLSTFDENGVKKNQGGDEFYITYSAPSPVEGRSNVPPDAVVAHIKDLENGQYYLELVQPLLPVELEKLENDILPGGTFTVFLQYTCGLGSYMPPIKQSWDHGGAINSKWEAKIPDNFLPPIAMARDRPKPSSFGEEMASYRAIYGMGNSLMRQFMGGYPGPDLMDTPRRENFGNIVNVGPVLSSALPLSLSTVDKFIGIAKWLVQEQGIEGDDGKDDAVIIGSGVWDLLANNEEEQPNFDDHLKAVRELIEAVQGLTSAKVYWKSMTAVHVHRVVGARGIERVKYCSTSRAKMLHDGQMELMKELDIPVLDMYDITYEAADHTQNGDARHYDGIFNEYMIDYFYPVEKGNDNLRLSDAQNAVEERLI